MQTNMRLLTLFGLTLALSILPDSAAAAGERIVCVNAAGEYVSRIKCKKDEARLGVTTVLPKVVVGPSGADGIQGNAGAKGPVGSAGDTGGLGFESCRTVTAYDTNLFDLGTAQLVATVSCDTQTEFLLTFGFNSNAAAPVSVPAFNRDANLRALTQAADITFDGKPTGIAITADRIATSSAYFLTVAGVCCPK